MSKTDAIDVLASAAHNRVGHRAFLELGIAELVSAAVPSRHTDTNWIWRAFRSLARARRRTRFSQDSAARAERTRTGCQARSRYRSRSLASESPRQFCDRMSLSDNIIQKGLASGAIGAVLCVNFGRQGRSEILPRRLHRRGGASVVRRDAANGTEDLDVKACKEATDGVSASRRSNDKIIATRCWRS